MCSGFFNTTIPVADDEKPGSIPTAFKVYNETGIFCLEYSLPNSCRIPASALVGRMGSPLPGRPPFQPRGNYGTNINGRYYTGHALDRMQQRGLTPTAVEEAIQNGIPSDNGSVRITDPVNGTNVVVSGNHAVVTVW